MMQEMSPQICVDPGLTGKARMKHQIFTPQPLFMPDGGSIQSETLPGSSPFSQDLKLLASPQLIIESWRRIDLMD